MVLNPGDLVLLSTKSHNAFRSYHKYLPRYSGPYLVKAQPSPNVCELDGLPTGVPALQNVSFLRLFQPSPACFDSRPQGSQGTQPVRVGQHWEWEVEGITDHRLVNGGMQYLVKWQGHDTSSWLRPRQLQHCTALLQAYQEAHQLPVDR